jgi:hypothetical protein
MARKTTKRPAGKTAKKPASAPTKKTSGKRAGHPGNLPALGRMMLWVDGKKNIDRLVYGLYALCTILFAADFFYHKHVEFGIEKIPGFYAIYGFVMCAALVICAKALRVILKRPEDYYAPYDMQSEEYPADQLERIDYDA